MADPPPAGRPPERLPLGIKLAYGAPSFASAGLGIPIGIYLTIFYTDTVLVPLGFVALVKALARAFDAITDPLMGWITDRTRTRWGRRRPWIAIGAPLAALAFVAMFAPPASLGTFTAAVWLAITYTLYYLFHTIYIIPHYGLGPELTPDYHERTRLFGWREAFVIAGTISASGLPPVLMRATGSTRGGYLAFAIFFGALLTALYFLLVWRIRERPDFAARTTSALVPGLRRVVRNRAFRIVLAVFLVGSITGAIPGLMMPYYVKYVLRAEDASKWIGIYLVVYFGAGFVSLPFWLRAALRFGKKPVWLASFVPGATAPLGFFFLDAGHTWMMFALAFWFGTGFGPLVFLVQSIQADVIDYDELHTGERREGQYAALWSFLSKFTVIPGMSIPLSILAAVGYRPNVEQTEVVDFTIRAIYGLAPATTAVLAFVIACLYPISQRVHEQIRDGIARHERGEPALDPLTGRTVPPPRRGTVDPTNSAFLDHFSVRELRRALDGRHGSVVRSALLGVLASLAVLALFIGAAVTELGDLRQEPGPLAVFCVVFAGLALSGVVFHGIRVRAARELGRRALPAVTLRAHLQQVEEERRRGRLSAAATA